MYQFIPSLQSTNHSNAFIIGFWAAKPYLATPCLCCDVSDSQADCRSYSCILYLLSPVLLAWLPSMRNIFYSINLDFYKDAALASNDRSKNSTLLFLDILPLFPPLAICLIVALFSKPSGTGIRWSLWTRHQGSTLLTTISVLIISQGLL